MLLVLIKQPLATITHNTFRHCRVRFYTFIGQPFLKQLYIAHDLSRIEASRTGN